MRTIPKLLFGLTFAAAVGVGGASAQPYAPVQDAPIVTDRGALAPPPSAFSARVVAPSPTLSPAGAESVTTAAIAEADVEFAEEDREIELGDNVSFGAHRVNPEEAMGGFLRTNPDFQRKNRKQLGFSVRF